MIIRTAEAFDTEEEAAARSQELLLQLDPSADLNATRYLMSWVYVADKWRLVPTLDYEYLFPVIEEFDIPYQE